MRKNWSVFLVVAIVITPVFLNAFSFIETYENFQREQNQLGLVSTVVIADGHLASGESAAWQHALGDGSIVQSGEFSVESASLTIEGLMLTGAGSGSIPVIAQLEWDKASGWKWIQQAELLQPVLSLSGDMLSDPLIISISDGFQSNISFSQSVLSVEYQQVSPENHPGSDGAVPEPSAIFLFAAGLLLVGLFMSRKLIAREPS